MRIPDTSPAALHFQKCRLILFHSSACAERLATGNVTAPAEPPERSLGCDTLQQHMGL